MAGEKNLATLIASMTPILSEREYVFSTLSDGDESLLAKLQPIGTFHEQEGLTVIVLHSEAEKHQLHYHGLFQCITLNVHSSLAAVGLTAAVSTKLAQENISANVVAAYYHDHIFVPADDAAKALLCLQDLARSYQ